MNFYLQKLKLRIILLPFSYLYGFITFFRNKLYDRKVISACSYDLPVISIGNLSVGGTGKSPHIEYLIRLIQSSLPGVEIGVISRGYKRKTKGFVMAGDDSGVYQVGDEPLQFINKFPDLTVAVCESRCTAISQMINYWQSSTGKKHSERNVVLLDDAYQHRAVRAGLSIMLTDYNNLFYEDFVLPAGTLREFRCGYKRADIIIITKVPKVLNAREREIIINKINPLSRQKVYFSFINYSSLKSLNNDDSKIELSLQNRFDAILLFTGIAKPYPLLEKLKNNCTNLSHLKFNDHHFYSEKDLEKIQKTFLALKGDNKIIITTEKDSMRLKQPQLMEKLINLPVYFIPVEVDFAENEKKMFNKYVLDFILRNNS